MKLELPGPELMTTLLSVQFSAAFTAAVQQARVSLRARAEDQDRQRQRLLARTSVHRGIHRWPRQVGTGLTRAIGKFIYSSNNRAWAELEQSPCLALAEPKQSPTEPELSRGPSLFKPVSSFTKCQDRLVTEYPNRLAGLKACWASKRDLLGLCGKVLHAT